jgi:alpha-mannosidase
VRLYEADGAPARAGLTVGFPLKRAELTNLMEDGAQELPVDVTEGGAPGPARLSLDFGPFEIVTIRLTPG